MAETRKLIGAHPVIGIRPIIDARTGVVDVRGTLEEQTMNMAKSVAMLFEEQLTYSDGTPVKTVIADGTIGRVSEASKCAEKFRRECVDITVSVAPCWAYSAETIDTDPRTIKAVWGMNATERPGSCYLSSVLASYTQKGLPVFGIYGRDVRDFDDESIPEDVQKKLLQFGRAAVAVCSLRGMSYLQIGSACMGIAGSIVDPDFMEAYLDMKVESVDEVEILRRIQENIYDPEEYERALAWAKENCKEGFDKNPQNVRKTAEEKEEEWQFIIKMMLIIKDLCRGNEKIAEKFPEEALGHNAIACGFQGQRQWTDYLPNCDFPEAILNTSFDYDGKREPYILATENDVLNGVGMLLMKQLTGRAQIFADCRTYWSGASVKRVTGYELEGHAKESDGFIHFQNSGATCLDATGKARTPDGDPVMKKWWEVTEEEQRKMLDATTWHYADKGYFRGGGFSSRFVLDEEIPLTAVRINFIKGYGPVMQIAEGWSVNLPYEVCDILWKRTDYTWPAVWFAPRCDGIPGSVFETAYDVMNNWGANHAALCYGHIGSDLITMASMLRIPVGMHNIADKDIFRPAAWTGLGSKDREASDFLACRTFGPIYKNYR